MHYNTYQLSFIFRWFFKSKLANWSCRRWSANALAGGGGGGCTAAVVVDRLKSVKFSVIFCSIGKECFVEDVLADAAANVRNDGDDVVEVETTTAAELPNMLLMRCTWLDWWLLADDDDEFFWSFWCSRKLRTLKIHLLYTWFLKSVCI